MFVQYAFALHTNVNYFRKEKMSFQCFGLLTIVFGHLLIQGMVDGTFPLFTEVPPLEFNTGIPINNLHVPFVQDFYSPLPLNTEHYHGEDIVIQLNKQQKDVQENVKNVTYFYEKTDRAWLVHPSRYYRVSNSKIPSITPYASYIPINVNDELNELYENGYDGY